MSPATHRSTSLTSTNLPARRILRRLKTDSYLRSGLLSWETLSISVALIVTAISSAVYPQQLPIARPVQKGLLALSNVGLVSSAFRKRRIADADVHETYLQEDLERRQLEVITAQNPHKTVLEMAMSQKGIETRIMNAFNATGNIRLSSCVESPIISPQYRRYLCEIYSISGRLSEIYNEETINQIRRDMQLMPNRSQTRGIFIHPVIEGTNKFAVDIERHEDDPDRHLPQLHSHLALSPAGLQLLIGFDYEKNSLVTKDVEKDLVTSILISGASGSGKSSWLLAFVNWLLANYSEQQVNFILCDLKIDDPTSTSPTFGSNYDHLPHMKLPVITDAETMLIALHAVYELMKQRNRQLSALASLATTDRHHISEASVTALHKKFPTAMPHLFFVVEEAQLMKVATYDAAHSKRPLWQVMAEEIIRLGRSAGIHLVLAYQKSSWNEVSLNMTENCSIKIAMRSGDEWSGAIALGLNPASKDPEATAIGKRCMQLAGRQDMIFRDSGGNYRRLQGLGSHNRPQDYPLVSHSNAPVYLGDNPDEMGWIMPVSQLETIHGVKAGIPLRGAMEVRALQSGVVTTAPRPSQQDTDDKRKHDIYQQWLEYYKNHDPFNLTDFVKHHMKGVGNTDKTQVAEQVIREMSRGFWVSFICDYIRSGGELDNRAPADLIDRVWGTKGTSHAKRINHSNQKAKELERLEWARGVIEEARRLAEGE